jgi:diaminopimelate decarboxylase
VVSGGELYTALQADFPAEKIYFHGNNKTEEELIFALDNGVGRIVVDNRHELELLNRLAKERDKTAKILFRIKPGIDAHTHSFIQTGQIDSKFGVALETGEAEEIIRHALTLSNISVVGIHCHIGSQIFELDPFRMAAKVMLGFMAKVRDTYGLSLGELNLGGGFGIKYVEEDPHLVNFRQVAVDVATDGYKYIPCCSSISNKYNSEDLLDYYKTNVNDEQILGYITAPWVFTTKDCLPDFERTFAEFKAAKEKIYGV